MIYPVISDKIKLLPLYITGIGIAKGRENIFRKNGFPSSQLSIITKGHGKFFCEGKEYELKKGTCFFFKRDIPHRYYMENGDFANCWITFNGYFGDVFFQFISSENHGVLQLNDLDGFYNRFERIYKLAEHSQEKTSSILYSMLMDIYSQLKHDDSKKDKNTILKNIIDFIEEYYTEDISLNRMEDAIGISKYTLCRLFKEQYGTTIFNYIIKFRLQKSKQLLSSGQSSTIKAIAHQVGFNDVSYFNMQFKKHEKITPAEFRKNRQ